MRVDELPESWTREPYRHEYPTHDVVNVSDVFDDPGSVRIVDEPAPREQPKIDDGARLGRPWEKTKRTALEEALTHARAMRSEAEAFIGWLSVDNPEMAKEYELIIDDAEARIVRLEKILEHR
jgi:hypothetical protein